MGLWLLLGLLWPGPAERQREIERLQADETYQRTLPIADAGLAPEPPVDHDDDSSRRTWSAAEEGVTGVLMWFVIGLTAVAIAVVAVREVRTRPARGHAAAAAEAPTPIVQLDAGTLADAETLARQELFGEAIHVLLLRTFAALKQQALLPDALTSREILARVRMDPEARSALGHLVQVVEVSFFGGAEPGAEDFERCRASYQAVIGAKGVQVT